MSRFYAEINGEDEVTTPRGTDHMAEKFLSAHIRGWNGGIIVECRTRGSEDIIEVWVTQGSFNPVKRQHLGTVKSVTSEGL